MRRPLVRAIDAFFGVTATVGVVVMALLFWGIVIGSAFVLVGAVLGAW